MNGRSASWRGRVVAITGAAGGIGLALTRACLTRGARVAALDLDASGLEALETWRHEYISPGGSNLPEPVLHTSTVDVSNRSQVLTWAEHVERALGPADVLINCAGVNLHVPILEMDPVDLAWLFDINFWGVVHATQALLPQLIRSGRGHIATVSSTFGFVAWPGSSGYVASKFAVRGFTESLELELGLQGLPITVSTVLPGGVKTHLVRNGRTRGHGPLSVAPEELIADFEEHLARLPPEVCAEKILKGLERRKNRIIVGADARALDLLVRLFPARYRNWFVRGLRWRAQRP